MAHEDETPWKDIQGELLESISNLSLSDRIRFRLTCKTWKAIKLPPRSIPLHLEFTSESQQCPWLMFSHSSSNGDCNYYHPLHNGNYLTHFPELANAIVCHSKNGWLLMYRGEKSLFFFHPLKRAVINLPDTQDNYDFTMVSFSSPPTSPDCVVFRTRPLWPEKIEVQFCYHGRNHWHSIYYDNPVPFEPSVCNSVFYNGVFHCLGKDGKLGVFDPVKRTWDVIAKLRGPNETVFMNFIAECDQDLVLVCFGNFGTPVRVFKLDFSQMKWVKLENLGDRMMFVSRTTSLLAPSVMKGTENKIYLPRFREEGNVFYSLSSGRYRIFDSEYVGENWYDTTEYMNCTWIDFNNDRVDLINPFSDEDLNWLSNAPEDHSEGDDSDEDGSEDDV